MAVAAYQINRAISGGLQNPRLGIAGAAEAPGLHRLEQGVRAHVFGERKVGGAEEPSQRGDEMRSLATEKILDQSTCVCIHHGRLEIVVDNRTHFDGAAVVE